MLSEHSCNVLHFLAEVSLHCALVAAWIEYICTPIYVCFMLDDFIVE